MGRTNKTLRLVVANNTLSTLRAVHRPCLVWGQHDDVNVLFFFFLLFTMYFVSFFSLVWLVFLALACIFPFFSSTFFSVFLNVYVLFFFSDFLIVSGNNRGGGSEAGNLIIDGD